MLRSSEMIAVHGGVTVCPCQIILDIRTALQEESVNGMCLSLFAVVFQWKLARRDQNDHK